MPVIAEGAAAPRRVVVESEGGRTRVWLAGEGAEPEEITALVHAVRWEHEAGAAPRVTLEMVRERVSVSVTGEQGG